MTSYGSLLSGYHYDWMLRARAAEIGEIDVALGWAGADVMQSADSASVSLVTRQGDTETLTGRYVVACDGSHSKIRDAAGIAQTVSEHNRKMVLLVFRSTGFIRILNGLRANSSTAC